MTAIGEPELFIETTDRGTSVFGTADYCGPTGTGMLCEYRYEVISDIDDARFRRWSVDNGRTWSDPVELPVSHRRDDGAIVRRTSSACFVDPGSGHLVFSGTEWLQESDDAFDALTRVSRFYALSADGGRSLFHEAPIIQQGEGYDRWHPIDGVHTGRNAFTGLGTPLARDGGLLFPVSRTALDADGRYFNPFGSSYIETGCLAARFSGDRLVAESVAWIIPDPERTTRGIFEPTLAALDGDRRVPHRFHCQRLPLPDRRVTRRGRSPPYGGLLTAGASAPTVSGLLDLRRRLMLKHAFSMVIALLCAGAMAFATGTTEDAAAGEPSMARIEYDPDSPTGGLTVPWVSETYSFDWVKAGPWPNDGVWEGIVRETLNLDATVTSFPFAEAGQKMELMITSDSLPELLFNWGVDVSKLDELGMAGKVLAYTDYLDVMPNFRTHLTEDPGLVGLVAARDGKIYRYMSWGSYAPTGLSGAGHLVRQDVFDSYGIETKWDTYDDFHDTLSALKQAEPDLFPWGTRRFSNMFSAMSNGFGTGWGGRWNAMYYDDRSDSWKYAVLDPGMEHLVAYLSNAYADGLLHPEIPTMNSDRFFEHWVDSTYRGLAVNTGDTPTWETSTFELGGEPVEVRYVKPPIATGIDGARPLFYRYRIGAWSPNRGFLVTDKAKQPEVLFQLLDYMFSPEGSWFFTWGVEDVTYRWYEHPEHGRIPLPIKTDPTKLEIDMDYYDALVADLQWGIGFGEWGAFTLSTPERGRPPYGSAAKEELQLRAEPDFRYLNPRVMLDAATQEDIGAIREQLDRLVEENLTAFVIGRRPLSEWSDFVQEVRETDVDALLEMQNTAYQETQKILSGT